MTKNEYLTALKFELKALTETEMNEIIRDQEEYINEAIRSGRREEDVVSALGSPKELAQELKVNFQINKADDEVKIIPKMKSMLKAIFALCVLAPFNLIFVLGPFCGLVGLLIGLWSTVLTLVLIGLVACALSFILIPFFSLFMTSFFGSMTATGLGVLCLFGCYALTKWFLKLSSSYLKWNMKFITGALNEK